MKRRDSLAALFAIVLGVGSPRALAQTSRRDQLARVAILDDASEGARAHLWALFRKRLRELGYTEGKDLVIEVRFAGGNPDQLPGLAAELVALKPDVIVAVTTTAALAAKKATSSIPIVAVGPADPVKSGLVASLARPGGNLTGISPNQADIAGKWLELLRELLPKAKSIAYLTDRGNPGEMLVFRELEAHARPFGIEVRALDGITARSVDQAFAAIAAGGIDALIVATTASLLGQRRQIVETAARVRLPAIYARQEYAEAGGLLSYGAAAEVVFARAAEYADRILHGVQAQELPFEMASTFRLVVNLKTAKALGLRIPQAVRIRADQVIE